jgi:glucose-6-phosphate 1-dehydrogenase
MAVTVETVARAGAAPGSSGERHPAPFMLVVFGATGDLTRRKLVPALYSLDRKGLLPSRFVLVGVGRRPLGDPAFRNGLQEGLRQFAGSDSEAWPRLSEQTRYFQGAYDDPASFRDLAALLARLDAEQGIGGNRLYYLATPPEAYAVITEQLGRAGLGGDWSQGWSRIVVEKPFGRDVDSARLLNKQLHQVFREEQIFRIDHYLGKETVQNILVFRLANGIFEPMWNRQYVDHVQISIAERIGLEGRGLYYEESGALRDMVQNHLLQLLCLVAMEPPASFDADAVRDEKVKLLHAIRPLDARSVLTQVVRGQYAAGRMDGQAVPGYRSESGVAAESQTETFVAMKLMIDNWRWAGVPFYVRTGKRLPRRVSEVAVVFRPAPHSAFRRTEAGNLAPNQLVLRIQPDEGIGLQFATKVPGPAIRIQDVFMDFSYGAFGSEQPEAYERLLLDAALGDSTLFTRRDEVEAAWDLVTPVLRGWGRIDTSEGVAGGAVGNRDVPLHTYEAGTWGPAAADELLARDGRAWRRP